MDERMMWLVLVYVESTAKDVDMIYHLVFLLELLDLVITVEVVHGLPGVLGLILVTYHDDDG